MKLIVYIILLAILVVGKIKSADSPGHVKPEAKELANGAVNPLTKLILNENENRHLNSGTENDNSSRLKRQIIYDPYYYYGRRRYYPIPIIVGIGGGFGYGGFGGRGFGGRGFGGRGFGGGGFGGHGFGGGRGGGGGHGGRG